MDTNKERISFEDMEAHLLNAAIAVDTFQREHAQLVAESDELLDRCLAGDRVLRDWAEELADTINNFSELRPVLSIALHGLDNLAAKVADGMLPDQEVTGIVQELARALEDLATHSAGIAGGLFGLTREVVERAESLVECDE